MSADHTKLFGTGISASVFQSVRFFLHSLLTSFSVLMLVWVPAQSTYAQSPIQQMQQLNATGRALEAYQMGMQLLPQLEGEPAFDLHYGVAAIDSGYASQGAFALERVLMNEPANDYARLELGRAYFILEEDDRAKAEFQAVLNANPPQDVVDNVKPYLTAIESRAAWRETTFSANVELGGGYDSNIVAAPEENNFGTGVTVGQLAESDSFFQIKADASINRPLKYGTNAFLSGSLTRRDNDSNKLNIASYGLQSGLIHRAGAHNFRLALQADILDLDSRKYRDSIGINGSWQYSITAQSVVTTFGQISKQNYNKHYVDREGVPTDLDFRDSKVSRLGIGYRYQFIAPLRPVISTTLSYGKDDADDDSANGALANVERDVLAANASLSLSINKDLTLTTVIAVEQSEYAGEAFFPDPNTPGVFTSRVRDEEQYRGALSLSWTPLDDLIIKLDGAVSPKRSNIDFLEYDRDQITLSVRYMYR